jgi:lysophospholipase L1-like esterase
MIKAAAQGVEVEIVNRGVSGELAEQAAQRLKIQVGLTTPDLVLWQVGTNDALSYVEVEKVEQVVTETVRWLKEHKVDVVLVGLQYVSGMARDSHYQAIRVALRRIAQRENVIIVRRYEAMEMLEKAQRAEPGTSVDEFANSETAYNCMARYVARAISVALFGRGLRARAAGADALAALNPAYCAAISAAKLTVGRSGCVARCATLASNTATKRAT